MDQNALVVQPIVRLKAASLGDEGLRWLERLPESVAELERRWSVTVERSLSGGTAAFVGLTRRQDGSPAVLKVSLPDRAFGDEIGTLVRAQGRGYVRVLAHDYHRGAMLLEALGPSLGQSGLTPERQLGTLARMLLAAWAVPRVHIGQLAVPHDKATALGQLVGRLWRELGRPCSQQVHDRALLYARHRAKAFDPQRCLVVHGDAAAANALRVTAARPGGEAGYVFVDPDGFLGDPAYDLGVAMRDWCAELLESTDPQALARRYSEVLAEHSGIDPKEIWEWGFLERVSTGLYVIAMGADELGRPFLETAETLMTKSPSGASP